MKLGDIVESLFNDAEDNFPEDEARITFKRYNEMISDEGLEYAERWLKTENQHMLNNAFDLDSDRERYMKMLNNLLNQ